MAKSDAAAVNTAAPAPAVTFDAGRVEAILQRAAELSAEEGEGPGLSAAEVEAIAEEVGIDPALARRAAAEALVPTAPAPPAVLEVPPGPIDPEGFDEPVQVAVAIPVRPSAAGRALLVEELGRRVGRGRATPHFRGLTWRRRRLQVDLEAMANGGARVLLQERPRLRSRLRPWALGLLGAILTVAVVIPFVVELLMLPEALVPLFVFGSLGGGGVLGVRLARRLHALEHRRRARELGYLGARLAALAQSSGEG